jgi:hypothetical protein
LPTIIIGLVIALCLIFQPNGMASGTEVLGRRILRAVRPLNRRQGVTP